MGCKTCIGVLLAALFWTTLGSAEDKIYQKGSSSPTVGTIVTTEDAGVQITLGAAGTTTIPRARIERVEIVMTASVKEGFEAVKKSSWDQVAKVFEPVYLKYKCLPQEWIEEMTIWLGQAYLGIKDWNKAKNLCLTFRKFYPESRFLDRTRGMEAKALMGLNQLAEAKVLLEEFTKRIENEASMTKEGAVTEEQNRALGPAFVVLGKCYEAANQNDKALEAYLKTTTIYYRDSNAMTEALMQSAGLFEKMKNPARARDQLEDLIKDYPDTPFAAEAKKKLDSLKPTNPSERQPL